MLLSKDAMDKVDIYLDELKLCVLGERRNCLRNFEHCANDVMARISEVPSRIVRIDGMEEGKAERITRALSVSAMHRPPGTHGTP